MARIPVRQAVYAALHQHLRASFPELRAEQVEREPLNPVPSDAPLPVLRCYDGDQAPGDTSTVPEIGYRMDWTVEGYEGVGSGAAQSLLPDRLNTLHARLIEAVLGPDEIIVQLADGALEIWLEETAFTLDRYGVEDSEFPTARFQQDFTLTVRVPRGVAFVETP